MKKIFLLISLLSIFQLCAALPRCGSCGKKCRRYIKTEENIYCSDVCLPSKYKCTLCKQPFSGGRNYIFNDLNGKTFRYCEICFKRPKCASCGNPLKKISRPDTANVKENLCQTCSREIITYPKALKLMRQLRLELSRTYGYDASHPITLHIIDKKTMTEKTGSQYSLGCMNYKRQTTTYTKVLPHLRSGKKRRTKKEVKVEHICEIYLLNTLSGNKIPAVLVHELTHDYLFHHLGQPLNSTVNEGICEAVSGAWLLKHGHKPQFEAIKKNPLTEYSGGFQKIYPQLKRYGFKRMLEMNKSSFKQFSD